MPHAGAVGREVEGENMQRIDDEYLNGELKLSPGSRLHRLVAMLFDTYYDDLTEQRIAELEEHVAQFRWMNAGGKRVDD
jgi:hypothetical protein